MGDWILNDWWKCSWIKRFNEKERNTLSLQRQISQSLWATMLVTRQGQRKKLFLSQIIIHKQLIRDSQWKEKLNSSVKEKQWMWISESCWLLWFCMCVCVCVILCCVYTLVPVLSYCFQKYIFARVMVCRENCNCTSTCTCTCTSPYRITEPCSVPVSLLLYSERRKQHASYIPVITHISIINHPVISHYH